MSPGLESGFGMLAWSPGLNLGLESWLGILISHPVLDSEAWANGGFTGAQQEKHGEPLAGSGRTHGGSDGTSPLSC